MIELEFEEWKDISSRLPRECYWAVRARWVYRCGVEGRCKVDDFLFGWQISLPQTFDINEKNDISAKADCETGNHFSDGTPQDVG